jgi:hypothetical protein
MLNAYGLRAGRNIFATPAATYWDFSFQGYQFTRIQSEKYHFESQFTSEKFPIQLAFKAKNMKFVTKIQSLS